MSQEIVVLIILRYKLKNQKIKYKIYNRRMKKTNK